jgi:hypothetical protein
LFLFIVQSFSNINFKQLIRSLWIVSAGMTLDYNPHDAFHQGHPQLIQAIDETLQSEDAIPYFEQAVAHYKEVVSSHCKLVSASQC